MDTKIFKLLNKARTQPEAFRQSLEAISWREGKAVIDSQEWVSDIGENEVTAVKTMLGPVFSELLFQRFNLDPVILQVPIDSHLLLAAVKVCLELKDKVFSNNIGEVSITMDKGTDAMLLRISFREPSEIGLKTMSMKSFQEKARKIAFEVAADAVLRKQFKKMMLMGNEWISELAKRYGPFTGYELNEFMVWFSAAEKSLPKTRPVPKARDPKPPVLAGKLIVNEGGMIPTGSVVISKPPPSQPPLNPVEVSANSFNTHSDSCTKFTFKAKQRYNDLKSLISSNKGNHTEHQILNMLEKECEETAKEPPISVPEKYEAFLLEEVLVAPPFSKTEPPPKPTFSTNFRLPDNLKVKIETAKKQRTDEVDIFAEPYKHRFRDEFDPKAANKPEFVLRLPRPKSEKVERISEPMEKLKNKMKEEKIMKETEEKIKRTELYGKTRGEWVSTFKPVSTQYEMGSGRPHQLLPKE
jgi:hypothetical protein